MSLQNILIFVGVTLAIIGVKTYFIKRQAPPAEIMAKASSLVACGEIVGLDVRSDAEVKARPSKKAKHVALHLIDEKVTSFDRGKTYFVFCESGARSSSAVSSLKKMGFEKVYNLGTWRDWNKLVP